MNKDSYIIVNADDFGLSSSVNLAILESFNQGLISTTTLMSNMPGFEEACDLTLKHGLSNRIGVHLNLTTGKPLTSKISTFKKFCDKTKKFCFNPYDGHYLNGEEKRAVYEELFAQTIRCIQFGIKPLHLDSHQHFHHFWSMGQVVFEIAKTVKIRAVRLAHNCGRAISLRRKVYANFLNFRMRYLDLAKTAYFCDLKDLTFEILNKKKPIEIMVHPYFNTHNQITNRENGPVLLDQIKSNLPGKKLVTYDYILKQIHNY